MNDRFRISALWRTRLADRGIPLQPVLRRAGLPAAFFDQEKIYATTAELFAFWRAIGETSEDPAIGLKLGEEPRLERSNPTAIIAMCSRSFRDALDRIARYKRLTCPEEIRVKKLRGEASVECHYPEATEDEPQVIVDLVLSWLVFIGRHGTDGRIRPLRVELTRPPKNRGLYETHFGCRVQFKAERNSLVYRDADLDAPFVTENAELAAVVKDRLDRDLEERDAPQDVREQVKRTLRRLLAGKRPVLDDVAHELCMSARTLQRRLTDAGLTFQQAVEETRRELAHHYLGERAIELNETAYLLGYEDANSFFRAFHAWEGTSPGAWRAQQLQTAGAARP